MVFQNGVRNEFHKCDTPVRTIRRIAAGFRKLGYDIGYAPFEVADGIHWGQVWIEALKLTCFGKGLTPALAKASAYAELAERFSAGLFFQEFEERVRFNIPALYDRATRGFLNYEWMEGYLESHPDDLSVSHLPIEALLVNETHLGATRLRAIKDSPMARHWVDAYSLLKGRRLKIPVNFVAYIHASNGMAAGNTIEEAMIQAACEIFERHAQITVVKPERTVPTIDAGSLRSETLSDLIDFFRARNVEVTLKDLSLDGLLPCVGVLFTNHNLRPGRLEHRILIPGAAFNTDEALSRCFTEAVQGRTTLEAPSPEYDRPVMHRSRVDNFYLLMKCCICLKDISFLERGEVVAYRPRRCEDIFAEIDALKAICRSLQTDCLLLNLTHPVLDFPVVRVVIPGISDFLPFLGRDVLTSGETRPDAVWKGERFKRAMASFFSAGGA